MINKTKTEAKNDMRKYSPDEFKLYVDEAGWESWMEDYTEAADGEEAHELEIKRIELEQMKMWFEAHPDTHPRDMMLQLI